MSNSSTPSLPRILAAALTLFSRHGFQRTSMADIAREAGIARATLYLHHADKRAVFEALAAALVDTALAGAEAAWQDGAGFADNLAATLIAKDLAFFRMMKTTPHGAELLQVDAALTAAHVQRLDTGFAALLERRARAADEAGADLSAFGGASGFASFVATAGAGLKHETQTEEAFSQAVERLAQVSARAAAHS